ncbi:FKBP-type peptidyl-prolyl cis-trans isomerase [Actinoplanes sp. NPDC051851]|uniref:FKBP-type peptidyl-prolyl cis-trans isomerase n=1 Tax=Actinoplanes sp. NPDC051851 TaxID=3154753 RepID=UPI003414118E
MSDSKRRSQAVAGGIAGAVVFVVLAVVFFVVRSGDESSAAAPASTAAPAATTSAAGVPAELATEPEVAGGTGTLDKLTATVLVPGTGPAVEAGQTITVNYKLIPYAGGDVIDSSWTRGEPLTTQIGTGQLIKGWDQGIPGQKVGSRVQLDVPADLAYGAEQGDLRFVVDILSAS